MPSHPSIIIQSRQASYTSPLFCAFGSTSICVLSTLLQACTSEVQVQVRLCVLQIVLTLFWLQAEHSNKNDECILISTTTLLVSQAKAVTVCAPNYDCQTMMLIIPTTQR